MGIFGAFAAGAKATAQDESLRRWKTLFQADEQIALAEQQLTGTQEAERNRLTLQKRQEDARLKAREREFDLTADDRYGQLTFELINTLGPVDGAALAQGLTDDGNRYATMSWTQVNTGFFKNPIEAKKVVDRFFEDSTYIPEWNLLKGALGAYSDMGQISSEDKEALFVAAEADLAQRGLIEEERQGYLTDEMRLSVQAAGANIDLTAAQAGGVRAQTAIDQFSVNNLLPEQERKMRAEADMSEAEFNDLTPLRLLLLAAEILGQEAANDLLGAQKDKTEAETGLIKGHLGELIRDSERADELHPIFLEHQQLVNDILAVDLDAQQVQLGFLPDQLFAALDNIQAQTVNLEDGHKFFAATFDSAVRQVAAEADISDEEARHLLAIGSVRDASARNDLDQGIATLAVINATGEKLLAEVARTVFGMELDADGLLTNQVQRDLALAQINSLDSEVARQYLGMRETKMAMISDMLREGSPDMLGALAPGILAELGIPPDEINGLVKTMQETASRDDRIQSDIEAAQARIALAEADAAEGTVQPRISAAVTEAYVLRETADDRIAASGLGVDAAELDVIAQGTANQIAKAELAAKEWENSTAAADRDLGVRLAEHGMWLDIEHLNLSRAAQVAGATPPALIERSEAEIHKLVSQATGLSIDGILQGVQEFNELASDLDLLNALVNGEGNYDEIDALAVKYGQSAENQQVAVAYLTNRVVAAQTLWISRMGAYSQAYFDASLQIVLGPETFGLQPGHPIYLQALSIMPFIQAVQADDAERQETAGRVETAVNSAALTLDPSTTYLGGAHVLYERLSEELGPEALAAVGINAPLDLQEDLHAATALALTEREAAEPGLTYVGGLLGRELDLGVATDRTEAISTLNNRALSLLQVSDSLQATLEDLRTNPLIRFEGEDTATRASYGDDIVRRTGITRAEFQEAGVMDVFGRFDALMPVMEFLNSRSQQRSAQALSIAFFNNK